MRPGSQATSWGVRARNEKAQIITGNHVLQAVCHVIKIQVKGCMGEVMEQVGGFNGVWRRGVSGLLRAMSRLLFAMIGLQFKGITDDTLSDIGV